ncbi:MAG: leucine-rich repeat domain-containing protein, partial [Lachnospiraceae bacterium]|nr:leucine-rich repeat domain-containing protein [Lachnospiraceae bacterium]
LLAAVCISLADRGETQAAPKRKSYTYQDFQYAYDADTEYIWITGYQGGEKVVEVPAEISGVPVRYISYLGNASKTAANRKITKVILPEGIEYLGGLGGCVCLREINIPDTVAEIGEYAFEDCRKLKAVELPNGLKRIGGSAFAGCKTLKAVKLPEGLEEIGDDVFAGCSSLEKVTIPDSVTKLGSEAFEDCIGLRSVKLSKRLTEIEDMTFAGCVRLKKIELPKNVKRIGMQAFGGCKKLKTITIRGTKLKQVGKNAFTGISKSAVFYAPKKQIAKYEKLLNESESFSDSTLTVKGGK